MDNMLQHFMTSGGGIVGGLGAAAAGIATSSAGGVAAGGLGGFLQAAGLIGEKCLFGHLLVFNWIFLFLRRSCRFASAGRHRRT